MTVRPFARVAAVGGACVAMLSVSACASSQFDRAFNEQRWSDAARAFDADSTSLHDESTLFRAAMLHSFPDRETYDPARAAELFRRLLQLYPRTSRRQAAVDQLSLLYELQRVQNTSATRAQNLQSEIAQLTADTMQLRARLNAVTVRLRTEQAETARLREDLQAREARLHALQEELQHLKAIDLKPPLH